MIVCRRDGIPFGVNERIFTFMSLRLASMIVYFLVMNSKRCNSPGANSFESAPSTISKGLLQLQFYALRLKSWSVCSTNDNVEDKLHRTIRGYLAAWTVMTLLHTPG